MARPENPGRHVHPDYVHSVSATIVKFSHGMQRTRYPLSKGSPDGGGVGETLFSLEEINVDWSKRLRSSSANMVCGCAWMLCEVPSFWSSMLSWAVLSVVSLRGRRAHGSRDVEASVTVSREEAVASGTVALTDA